MTDWLDTPEGRALVEQVAVALASEDMDTWASCDQSYYLDLARAGLASALTSTPCGTCGGWGHHGAHEADDPYQQYRPDLSCCLGCPDCDGTGEQPSALVPRAEYEPITMGNRSMFWCDYHDRPDWCQTEGRQVFLARLRPQEGSKE